jgi:hypothetical protein
VYTPLTAPRQFDILHPALAGGDRMQFDHLQRRDFITLFGAAAAVMVPLCVPKTSSV